MPRRPTLHAAVLALGAATALAACGDALEGTGPVIEALPFVEATVSPARATAGSPVTVDVVFRNGARTPLTIGGGPFASLEVRDAAGRVVALGRFGPEPLIAYAPVTLAPGETARSQVTWSGELTENAVGRAAPGRYQVRAAVHVLGPSQGTLYSGPVPLELLAP